VTGAAAFVCGVLTVSYSFWKLAGVKKEHDREIGKGRAGGHGEGFMEQMKRKGQEKEPEAGML
jgi:hypothetical protein